MLSERLGTLELLAVLHRLQRHVLPDAPARPAGHAAAHLHLPGRDGLGRAEPRRRRVGALIDRVERAAVRRQRRAQPSRRRARAGADPWGARHARMGDAPRRRRRTTSSRCRSSHGARAAVGAAAAQPAHVAGLAVDAPRGAGDDACSTPSPTIALIVPDADDLAVRSARSPRPCCSSARSSRRGPSSGASVPVAIALIALVLADAARERASTWRWSSAP